MIDPPSRRAHLPGMRRRGAQLARLRKRLGLAERAGGGFRQALLSAVAAVLAWLPTQPLGMREGFWAAITAIAVAQSEVNAARSTARDQFAGAAIGGLTAVGIAVAMAPGIGRYAIGVVVAILCCWLLNVASAARLAGITATIILLVPHQGSAGHMMLSRVGEVGWGVLMAMLVVWSANVVQERWRRLRNGVTTTRDLP